MSDISIDALKLEDDLSGNGNQSSESSPVPFQPYIRFRRAARAIRMLVNVCLACKSIMQAQVMRETWYAMADSIVDGGQDPSSDGKRRSRPFITFVPNDDGQLEQLCFDPCQFSRDSSAEHLMTEEILESLKEEGSRRTPDQVNEMLRFMKRLSRDFCRYPLDIQRQLCESFYYGKYQRNRVILKKGLLADGMHILVSGEAVVKTEGRKQPRQLRVGELFGMEELMCGSTRKITVLTQSTTELISLHRFDYQRIFNLAEDAENPKHLKICKNDIVFQHFPMQKLADNPGVWTVLAFKFGRLMVQNSNETEWIYIVKSGEARVLKTLPAGRYDVQARRQKIQKILDSESPYHKAHQMLDFTSDKHIKSNYRAKEYYPSRLRKVQSAPPGGLRTYYESSSSSCSRSRLQSRDSCRSSKSARLKEILNTGERPATVPNHSTTKETVRNTFMELPDDGEEEFDNPNAIDNEVKRTVDDVRGCNNQEDVPGDAQEGNFLPDMKDKPDKTRHVQLPGSGEHDSASYIKTGGRTLPKPRSYSARPHSKTSDSSNRIPPFVQIETLHAGNVFGFRACLPEEDRGPPASLVSGGCEVLLVNKKFFTMHCDEAINSLIKLKYKPFPTEEELIDRLDANLQWQEFKNKTMAAQIRSMKHRKQALKPR